MVRVIASLTVVVKRRMDFDRRGVALGFLTTGVILALLVWTVGAQAVWNAFTELSVRSILLVLGAGLVWMISWAVLLHTILYSLDIRTSISEAFTLFASAEFANNVTPFGQAGGKPLGAFFISRATRAEYETCLGGLVSMDAINLIPSIGFAILGTIFYAARFAVTDDLLLALGIVTVLVGCTATAAVLVWTRRRRVEAMIVRIGERVLLAFSSAVSIVPPPSEVDLAAHISGFFDAIERVGERRDTLGQALVYSTVGWLFAFLVLFLSIHAITGSVSIPLFMLFLVIPITEAAILLPLPGGAGGAEAALVLLLVPTTALTAPTAASVALVYRGATYWLATLLGGIATAVIEANNTS